MDHTTPPAAQGDSGANIEIVAVAAELDGVLVPELQRRGPSGALGGGAGVDDVLAAARTLAAAGVRLLTLEIAPLSEPWDAQPDPASRRFKSGCAPVLALERARDALASAEADAVLIHGEDPLRTGYGRAERKRRMDIWPGRFGAGRPSIPEAYTRLAEAWCARHGIGASQFKALADALLERYAATARSRGLGVDLAPLRTVRVTRLFRLGDCANPNVDFRGAALLMRPGWDRAPRLAEAVDRASRAGGPGDPASTPRRAITLAAVASRKQPDGPDHLDTLARYAHLRQTARQALAQAGLLPGTALRRAWADGRLLLEAYTCFPVVPLAFLVETGLAAPTVESLQTAIGTAPLTVTGGMNLARAPWNNPVLHALAVMWAWLRGDPRRDVGLLHGNGGLGGWQGIAVLRVRG